MHGYSEIVYGKMATVQCRALLHHYDGSCVSTQTHTQEEG